MNAIELTNTIAKHVELNGDAAFNLTYKGEEREFSVTPECAAWLPHYCVQSGEAPFAKAKKTDPDNIHHLALVCGTDECVKPIQPHHVSEIFA
jgi:hypothetical protein